MEILKYGMLYIFCRQDERVSDYVDRERQLLQAETIHLQVLAPAKYYEKFDLSWLEANIAKGLPKFLAHRKFAFEMYFSFNSFSQDPSCVKNLEPEASPLILSRVPVTWRLQ